MKAKRFTLTYLATLLFTLLSVATGSAATTHPLKTPQGLALDSQGNLYVANNGGNQVLVYNPSYVQLPGKTITQNVVNPTGVAFDPNGNLWIVNAGNDRILQFNSAGTQESNFPAQGTPYAIAVDAIGDLWVETDYGTVTIYSQVSAIPLLSFSNPTDAFTGIATYQGIAVIGTNTQMQLRPIAPTLAGQGTEYPFSETGFAVAFDTASHIYSGNIDNTLSVYSFGVTKTLAKLGFFPYGIAVDSTRGRIYVSDGVHSKIAVYSTSGVLLHTIF
jgi:serine/threonine-protein kinase